MIELIAVVVCILLNAAISAVEMAFVSVEEYQLRKLAADGNRDAKVILSLHKSPERTLSVLQVGITMLGALGAAVGGAGSEQWIEPWLTNGLGLSHSTSQVLSIVMVVLPITFFSVVVGELVPKSLALRSPLSISLRSARWLCRSERVLVPIVNVLEWSTKALLKLISPKHKKQPAGATSGAELIELQSLSAEHRQYVLNLVHIERHRVRDILRPWNEVLVVDTGLPIEEVEKIVITSGHTRLPVLKGPCVMGVLNTKEFLALRATGSTTWEYLARPVVFSRPGDSVLQTLKRMQQSHVHMSIVAHDDQHPIGIVTMEDIIEEIVGEIFDEDDDGVIRRIMSRSRRFRYKAG